MEYMVEHSLEDILREGERLYLNKFKEELEKGFYGQYAVIDIEKEDYIASPNKLQAIDEAKKKFGEKLFYTVQVGNLEKPTVNYRTKQNAWIF
jgi:hypothetical protein